MIEAIPDRNRWSSLGYDQHGSEHRGDDPGMPVLLRLLDAANQRDELPVLGGHERCREAGSSVRPSRAILTGAAVRRVTLRLPRLREGIPAQQVWIETKMRNSLFCYCPPAEACSTFSAVESIQTRTRREPASHGWR
jgi:hypothetical protein